MTRSQAGIAFAFFTSFIWAFQGIVLKYILKFVDPDTVVWFRFLVAALFLAWYLWKNHLLPMPLLKRPPLKLLLAGVFLAANYLWFLLGIKYTGPANAQIVIQLGPLFLGLIGIFYFQEKMNLRGWVGFLLVGLGLALFFNDQLAHLLNSSGPYWWGSFLILSAAFVWSLYGMITKSLSKHWLPQQLNFFIYLECTILTSFRASPTSLMEATPITWIILVFLGFCTVFAYGAFAEALVRIPANQVSVILAFNPILTLILIRVFWTLGVDWIPLEQSDWLGYVGAFFVLAGTVLATSKKLSSL